ncbi:MAG TPA: four helix bundle protein [Candidatus Uhrbacteria bacterium]|nr:four helix bundle protein [Candidatus Uhrbacteria bacterium]
MQKQKDIFENFSEKFPILNKTYDLYKDTSEISKNEENTLRKSSEITVLEILELIVIATRQGREEKRQTLKQALRKLDTLKVFIDMAGQLKLLNEKNQSQIKESVDSVGKMLGGWMKALKPAETASAA